MPRRIPTRSRRFRQCLYRMDGMIFDIVRNSFVDGPGIRTTVFFKGCNLACRWCHNPESQVMAAQLMFFKNKCRGCGRCKEVCQNDLQECHACGACATVCHAEARKISGKKVTAEELFAVIEKDKPFYEASGGGVTFSGGECMLQPDFLTELLSLCRAAGIHTAVDTAGAVPWTHFMQIMPYTSMLLYDVKCITEALHREGTGRSNSLILDNLQRLSREFAGEIIVRVPVIGGFNDSREEMGKIAAFLHFLGHRVELLPYHKMGEHKYDALRRSGTVFTAPSDAQMTVFKEMFNQ